MGFDACSPGAALRGRLCRESGVRARACRHKMCSQSVRQRIWKAASNEEAPLQQRAARPRRLLDLLEGVPHEAAQLAYAPVAGPLPDAVALRRHRRLGPRGGDGPRAGVGVAGAVGRDELCRQLRYELRQMPAIRLGTSRDRESDRHTMRIHGQAYLGVGPPFARPTASAPPTAPAAPRRALTQAEPTMGRSKSGSSTAASSSRSHTPLSRRRQNLRRAFFQPP